MKSVKTPQTWDFVAAADIHLRDDVPRCRMDPDEYFYKQFSKLKFMVDLANQHCCPLIIAGDLFDHSTGNTPRLFSNAISCLQLCKWGVLAVPGQHDLPNHDLRQIKDSAFEVLRAAGVLRHLECWNDGDVIMIGRGWKASRPEPPSRDNLVLVTHELVWLGNRPFPGAPQSGNVASVVKRYPEYQVIISGDNHITNLKKFNDGPLVINPGSMMRMDADQVNHKPCVFLVNVRQPLLKQVFLPITPGVISREHIEVVAARNKRIETFVRQLRTKQATSVDFKDNLRAYFANNMIDPETEALIWKMLNE